MVSYASHNRAVLLAVLLFAIQLAGPLTTPAKTVHARSQAKQKAVSSTNREKKFFVNLLHDQQAIWTSPFRLHERDGVWLAPFGLATIALVASDRHTSGALVKNGDNLERLRVSRDISRLGSSYTTGGFAAVLYLTGRAFHNDRLRETGLLGAEALLNSTIVVSGLKSVSQRQRPPVDNSSGEFFAGGSSFPSGHAANIWSVATVVAEEYGHNRPVVQVGVYGLAAAVSVSRFTARKHFLSDVLVGSALGYGIGRYVYHKHHDTELDARNENRVNDLAGSKWYPSVLPLYYPRTKTFGGRLAWSF
jgi:membrane-associated phospholipid phosphatase